MLLRHIFYNNKKLCFFVELIIILDTSIEEFMTTDNNTEIVKTVPEKQEIQDIIEDVIEEIQDIIQEIKDIENVEDVIEVIEHVSQDVEIVVQKIEKEKESENSLFKCFFNWFGTIF